MGNIKCVDCGGDYPPMGMPHVCPDCGGIYDWSSLPKFLETRVERSLPGIWRFRTMFGLFPGAPVVTLGEGNTPLIWDACEGVRVGLKLESLNPSGSYKDRASAVLASQMLARNVGRAVEDSSGNAGASFAAYAARVGIEGEVYVPEDASGPKRDQIEAYGAHLVRVKGPRSAAAEAVLRAVGRETVYASHAFLPFGMAGIATIAYELFEQLGDFGGTVITPVGHGSLLLGIVRGFHALFDNGYITRLPQFVGVQAENCAPLYHSAAASSEKVLRVPEGETLAEGVRVSRPVRGPALLKEMKNATGIFMAITEELLVDSFKDLNQRGIHVEPTSALAWAAVKQRAHLLPEPVILILTGSGLKIKKLEDQN